MVEAEGRGRELRKRVEVDAKSAAKVDKGFSIWMKKYSAVEPVRVVSHGRAKGICRVEVNVKVQVKVGVEVDLSKVQ